MVKQRVGWKVVIKKEALERIKNDQCPACGKPKDKWTRRKDWRCCSRKCTQKYASELVYYGWQHLRTKALNRDGHKCVKCGNQPTMKKYAIGYFLNNDQEFKKHYKEFKSTLGFGNEKMAGQDMLYAIVIDSSKLIGDHIIPIACGGEEFDLDNVQTLCETCNKIKTKQDHGEIAKMRRIENVLQKGQTQIFEALRRKRDESKEDHKKEA